MIQPIPKSKQTHICSCSLRILNNSSWPFGKKWAATAIASAFAFISPISSSMLAPVSSQVASEFGTSNYVLIAMFTSVFVLAYGTSTSFHLFSLKPFVHFLLLFFNITAIGPLVLAPLSEIFGRSIILQLSNLVFLVFNLAGGFARNPAELIIFRFISGLGGSAPNAVCISFILLGTTIATTRVGIRRCTSRYVESGGTRESCGPLFRRTTSRARRRSIDRCLDRNPDYMALGGTSRTSSITSMRFDSNEPA